MEYDAARAEVLLNDLERASRGRAPAMRLEPPSDTTSGVRAVGTRFGLLRLGIRLAQAALTAQTTVTVYEDGEVQPDASSVGARLQIALVDDPPAPQNDRRIAPPDWLTGVACAFAVLVFFLSAIGLVTVVRFVIEL